VCTTAVNRNFSALSPTIDVFLTNCLPDYIVVLSLAKQCYLVMRLRVNIHDKELS
ncbi:hypothetical protein ONQ60_28260, partial [Salmonella enterica subsp. enterica serovar Virginia]|nr:hypothetical protein [Salmonella enterica subsp. enterica serovar Virginia]